MPTVNTQDLAGAALDWAVYQCMQRAWINYDSALGRDLDIPQRPICDYARDYEFGPGYSPSTGWSRGGPIIEREGMSITHQGTRWAAQTDSDMFTHGPTALVAAMRCLVASKLGATVDVRVGVRIRA